MVLENEAFCVARLPGCWGSACGPDALSKLKYQSKCQGGRLTREGRFRSASQLYISLLVFCCFMSLAVYPQVKKLLSSDPKQKGIIFQGKRCHSALAWDLSHNSGCLEIAYR